MYNSDANDASVIVVRFIYDDDFMSIADHHTDNVTTRSRAPDVNYALILMILRFRIALPLNG